VRQCLAHQRRQLVREVDAGVPADDRLVGFVRRPGFHPRHRAYLATADAQGLGAQFRHLGGSEGAGHDHIPVAGIPVRDVVEGSSAGFRSRPHRAMPGLRHGISFTP
jgi:hypothetical protein